MNCCSAAAALRRGMTIALFHQSGTCPFRKDQFSINVITGVSTSTDCFRSQVGIGSRLHVAFNEPTIILCTINFWEWTETAQPGFRWPEFNMRTIKYNVVNMSFDHLNLLAEKFPKLISQLMRTLMRRKLLHCPDAPCRENLQHWKVF